MGFSKSKIIRLGIFIVAGFALFLFALFYIGSKENLFTKSFNVYSIFSNVSGLSQGSSVQFGGISVGTIESIEIIAADKVKVNMSIVVNVQKFIKKDATASINSDGLVGNKVLVITSMANDAPTIENGDSIHSIQPVSFNDILNNLNKSTKEASDIVEDLSEVMGKVNKGDGTLGQLVNNNSLYNNLDSLLTSFSSSSSNINKILSQASGILEIVTEDLDKFHQSADIIVQNVKDITDKINSSESLVGTLLTDTVFANNVKNVMVNADQTTANLELGSFSFYQNMEALKHNFLFKGYFEDLGYWNKTKFEKTVQAKETQLYNKEHNLDLRELKLKIFQKQLDSLRNIIDMKLDSLNNK